ncbi:hypothetical protein P691DRAFT_806734 [Macrolepiota fuliginosa MF-IS2]|uniref:Chromo domain-containing protein n=1 Tax=Macrolepiota fuliginosa MF-IS2 TaxID=1400762 RepID=A0A9P6C705_9AGAR|nr:hypothetical protein P691DRAFT_806734 [Macrolepiota fuliginosa MF-IS2]
MWGSSSFCNSSWEPIEHLQGSEETLSRFWERINTGGRDHRDLKHFTAGEVFLPIGPPRKRRAKEKEKSPAKEEIKESFKSTSGVAPLKRLHKREHDNDTDAEDDHSPKRPRQALESFHSKPNLLLTDTGSPIKTNSVETLFNDLPLVQEKRSSSPQRMGSPELEINEDLLVSSSPDKNGSSNKGIATPPAKSNATMPLHRARAANPLVKLLSDHHQASLKSHNENNLSEETNTGKQTLPPKRRRPGPGRSSDGLLIRPPTLLTAEKGKLKSVRGKANPGNRAVPANDLAEDEVVEKQCDIVSEVAMDLDIPVEPPKPDELLQLAGLDPSSTTLADYEDEDKPKPTSAAQVAGLEQIEILSPTIKESLFPSTTPVVGSNPAWRRSTIFGPLGLGTDATSLGTNEGNIDESSIPFQINLDASTTIPVLFVDAITSSTFPGSAMSRRGPPGKFYRGSHATDLLGTLRTKGSFARVRLSPEVDARDQNFKHLVKRLINGELFVAMIDRDLLAFCASGNALFAQRLNVPPSLLSVEGILVTHVSIEDHSAFANATANADDTIWSQYILSADDV